MNTIIADEIQKKEEAHTFEAVRRALEDIDPIDRDAVRALYELAERQAAKLIRLEAGYAEAIKRTREHRDRRLREEAKKLNKARRFVGEFLEAFEAEVTDGEERGEIDNRLHRALGSHWRSEARGMGEAADV